MELNAKYSELLHSLEDALIDFKRSLDADLLKYDQLEQNWIKNAQIQKFEFCIELLWKTAKVYFESEGEIHLTPRQNMKAIFTHQMVTEEKYLELLDCLESRNLLSHVYKAEMFDVISLKMEMHFAAILSGFNGLKNAGAKV